MSNDPDENGIEETFQKLVGQVRDEVRREEQEGATPVTIPGNQYFATKSEQAELSEKLTSALNDLKLEIEKTKNSITRWIIVTLIAVGGLVVGILRWLLPQGSPP